MADIDEQLKKKKKNDIDEQSKKKKKKNDIDEQSKKKKRKIDLPIPIERDGLSWVDDYLPVKGIDMSRLYGKGVYKKVILCGMILRKAFANEESVLLLGLVDGFKFEARCRLKIDHRPDIVGLECGEFVVARGCAVGPGTDKQLNCVDIRPLKKLKHYYFWHDIAMKNRAIFGI